MNALQNFLHALLGPDGKANDLTLFNISVRALFIFFFGLALVRVGDRRSLSEKTAFDAIFIVLVGSVLSRAINGTAPFFTTMAAGIVLVAIHRACAFGACRSHWFGWLLKGNPVALVQNGQINRQEMQRALVSPHDLEEDLRLHGKTEDLGTVRLAMLERSGDISFIKNEG